MLPRDILLKKTRDRTLCGCMLTRERVNHRLYQHRKGARGDRKIGEVGKLMGGTLREKGRGGNGEKGEGKGESAWTSTKRKR